MNPYIEETPINRPLDWLFKNDWNYLADYCDEYDYHFYDTLYAYIQGEIELKDLIKNNFESITKEEALKIYNEGFPKVLANGLINIANSIIEDDLILKFTTE